MMMIITTATLTPSILMLLQQVKRIEQGEEAEDSDAATLRGLVTPLLLGVIVIMMMAQIAALLIAR